MSQSPTRPFQFTLGQLLLLTAACCVLSAGVYWLGWWMALPIGLAGIVAVGILLSGSKRTAADWVVMVLVVLVLAALLLPALQPPRQPSKRMQCSTNLRHISMALLQYESNFGCFPPAYIADENGKPMHSWRVLILPYIEQKALYDRYHFDEPWNGPNNSKLHRVRMPLFECLSDKRRPGETSYVAVVGPETAWPGTTTSSIAEITNKDGDSNTVLLAEIHNSGIHWMEPRDLDMSKMAMAINPKHGAGISSGHPKGALVSFVDVHTRFISDDLPPETVRALLTIAGGEKVGEY